MSDEDAVKDLVDAQIAHQGVGCICTNDGHVFTFSREVLERLLAASLETGKAIVFVKHSVKN